MRIRELYFNVCVTLSENKIFRILMAGMAITLLITNVAYADDGGDLLSVVRGDAETNFGPKSTFMIFIYVFESVGCVWAFIKTKNLAMLGTFPVLVLASAGISKVISAML